MGCTDDVQVELTPCAVEKRLVLLFRCADESMMTGHRGLGRDWLFAVRIALQSAHRGSE